MLCSGDFVDILVNDKILSSPHAPKEPIPEWNENISDLRIVQRQFASVCKAFQIINIDENEKNIRFGSVVQIVLHPQLQLVAAMDDDQGPRLVNSIDDDDATHWEIQAAYKWQKYGDSVMGNSFVTFQNVQQSTFLRHPPLHELTNYDVTTQAAVFPHNKATAVWEIMASKYKSKLWSGQHIFHAESARVLAFTENRINPTTAELELILQRESDGIDMWEMISCESAESDEYFIQHSLSGLYLAISGAVVGQEESCLGMDDTLEFTAKMSPMDVDSCKFRLTPLMSLIAEDGDMKRHGPCSTDTVASPALIQHVRSGLYLQCDLDQVEPCVHPKKASKAVKTEGLLEAMSGAAKLKGKGRLVLSSREDPAHAFFFRPAAQRSVRDSLFLQRITPIVDAANTVVQLAPRPLPLHLPLLRHLRAALTTLCVWINDGIDSPPRLLQPIDDEVLASKAFGGATSHLSGCKTELCDASNPLSAAESRSIDGGPPQPPSLNDPPPPSPPVLQSIETKEGPPYPLPMSIASRGVPSGVTSPFFPALVIKTSTDQGGKTFINLLHTATQAEPIIVIGNKATCKDNKGILCDLFLASVRSEHWRDVKGEHQAQAQLCGQVVDRINSSGLQTKLRSSFTLPIVSRGFMVAEALAGVEEGAVEGSSSSSSSSSLILWMRRCLHHRGHVAILDALTKGTEIATAERRGDAGVDISTSQPIHNGRIASRLNARDRKGGGPVGARDRAMLAPVPPKVDTLPSKSRSSGRGGGRGGGRRDARGGEDESCAEVEARNATILFASTSMRHCRQHLLWNTGTLQRLLRFVDIALGLLRHHPRWALAHVEAVRKCVEGVHAVVRACLNDNVSVAQKLISFDGLLLGMMEQTIFGWNAPLVELLKMSSSRALDVCANGVKGDQGVCAALNEPLPNKCNGNNDCDDDDRTNLISHSDLKCMVRTMQERRATGDITAAIHILSLLTNLASMPRAAGKFTRKFLSAALFPCALSLRCNNFGGASTRGTESDAFSRPGAADDRACTSLLFSTRVGYQGEGEGEGEDEVSVHWPPWADGATKSLKSIKAMSIRDDDGVASVSDGLDGDDIAMDGDDLIREMNKVVGQFLSKRLSLMGESLADESDSALQRTLLFSPLSHREAVLMLASCGLAGTCLYVQARSIVGESVGGWVKWWWTRGHIFCGAELRGKEVMVCLSYSLDQALDALVRLHQTAIVESTIPNSQLNTVPTIPNSQSNADVKQETAPTDALEFASPASLPTPSPGSSPPTTFSSKMLLALSSTISRASTLVRRRHLPTTSPSPSTPTTPLPSPAPISPKPISPAPVSPKPISRTAMSPPVETTSPLPLNVDARSPVMRSPDDTPGEIASKPLWLQLICAGLPEVDAHVACCRIQEGDVLDEAIGIEGDATGHGVPKETISVPSALGDWMAWPEALRQEPDIDRSRWLIASLELLFALCAEENVAAKFHVRKLLRPLCMLRVFASASIAKEVKATMLSLFRRSHVEIEDMFAVSLLTSRYNGASEPIGGSSSRTFGVIRPFVGICSTLSTEVASGVEPQDSRSSAIDSSTGAYYDNVGKLFHNSGCAGAGAGVCPAVGDDNSSRLLRAQLRDFVLNALGDLDLVRVRDFSYDTCILALLRALISRGFFSMAPKKKQLDHFECAAKASLECVQGVGNICCGGDDCCCTTCRDRSSGDMMFDPEHRSQSRSLGCFHRRRGATRDAHIVSVEEIQDMLLDNLESVLSRLEHTHNAQRGDYFPLRGSRDDVGTEEVADEVHTEVADSSILSQLLSALSETVMCTRWRVVEVLAANQIDGLEDHARWQATDRSSGDRGRRQRHVCMEWDAMNRRLTHDLLRLMGTSSSCHVKAQILDILHQQLNQDAAIAVNVARSRFAPSAASARGLRAITAVAANIHLQLLRVGEERDNREWKAEGGERLGELFTSMLKVCEAASSVARVALSSHIPAGEGLSSTALPCAFLASIVSQFSTMTSNSNPGDFESLTPQSHHDDDDGEDTTSFLGLFADRKFCAKLAQCCDVDEFAVEHILVDFSHNLLDFVLRSPVAGVMDDVCRFLSRLGTNSRRLSESWLAPLADHLAMDFTSPRGGAFTSPRGGALEMMERLCTDGHLPTSTLTDLISVLVAHLSRPSNDPAPHLGLVSLFTNAIQTLPFWGDQWEDIVATLSALLRSVIDHTAGPHRTSMAPRPRPPLDADANLLVMFTCQGLSSAFEQTLCAADTHSVQLDSIIQQQALRHKGLLCEQVTAMEDLCSPSMQCLDTTIAFLGTLVRGRGVLPPGHEDSLALVVGSIQYEQRRLSRCRRNVDMERDAAVSRSNQRVSALLIARLSGELFLIVAIQLMTRALIVETDLLTFDHRSKVSQLLKSLIASVHVADSSRAQPPVGSQSRAGLSSFVERCKKFVPVAVTSIPAHCRNSLRETGTTIKFMHTLLTFTTILASERTDLLGMVSSGARNTSPLSVDFSHQLVWVLEFACACLKGLVNCSPARYKTQLASIAMSMRNLIVQIQAWQYQEQDACSRRRLVLGAQVIDTHRHSQSGDDILTRLLRCLMVDCPLSADGNSHIAPNQLKDHNHIDMESCRGAQVLSNLITQLSDIKAWTVKTSTSMPRSLANVDSFSTTLPPTISFLRLLGDMLTNEMGALHSTVPSLESAQNKFMRLGAVDAVVRIIQWSRAVPPCPPQVELAAMAFRFASRLLAEKNRQMQAAFVELLVTSQRNLTCVSDDLGEGLHSFEEAFTYWASKCTLRYQTESQRPAISNASSEATERMLVGDVVKWMFSFTLNLCAGHNDASKTFLGNSGPRTNGSHEGGVNIIVSLANLTNSLLVSLQCRFVFITSREFCNDLAPLAWAPFSKSLRRRFVDWAILGNDITTLAQDLGLVHEALSALREIVQGPTTGNQLSALPLLHSDALARCLEFASAVNLVAKSEDVCCSEEIIWAGNNPASFDKTLQDELRKIAERSAGGSQRWMVSPPDWLRKHSKDHGHRADTAGVQHASKGDEENFNRNLADLCGVAKRTEISVVRFLVAMLEGSNDTILRHVVHLDPAIVMQNLDMIYRDVVRSRQNSANLTPFKCGVAERSDFNRALNTAEHLVAYISLVSSLSTAANAQRSTWKNLLHHWRVLNPKVTDVVASVEILDKEGNLQRVHFPIPVFVTQYWPYPEVQAAKDSLLWEVSRTTPEEKMQDFHRRLCALILVMRRQQTLRALLTPQGHAIFGGRNVFYGTLVGRIVPSQEAAFLILTVILNVFYAYESFSPAFVPPKSDFARFVWGWPALHDAVLVCCSVQTSLAGTLLLRSLFNSRAADAVIDMSHPQANVKVFRALSSCRVAVEKIFAVVMDCRWQIFMMTCSVLGTLWWPSMFSLCLLDIVPQSRFLMFIVRAVLKNVWGIGYTLLLAIVILYLCSIVAYLYFPDQYGFNGHYQCEENVGSCFKLHVDYGLNNPLDWGGTSYIDPRVQLIPDNTEIGQLASKLLGSLYNLFFLILINLVLQAIITGLITDTFSMMRAENEAIALDIKDKCFVCSLPQETFDNCDGRDTAPAHPGVKNVILDRRTPFAKHVQEEHCEWMIVWFKIHLDSGNESGFSGLEHHAHCHMGDAKVGASASVFPQHNPHHNRAPDVCVDHADQGELVTSRIDKVMKASGSGCAGGPEEDIAGGGSA